jgi:hypothetical protein
MSVSRSSAAMILVSVFVECTGYSYDMPGIIDRAVVDFRSILSTSDPECLMKSMQWVILENYVGIFKVQGI